MFTRLSSKVTLLVSLVLVFVLAACGGAAPANNSNSNTNSNNAAAGGSPADAARSFFQAVFSGEGDAAQYICNSNTTAAEAMRQGMETMRTSLAAGDATIDTSNLVFETTSESGDTAQVRVSGKIGVTVAGTAQEVDYQEATIPMRNENGSWKVCA